MLPKVTIMIPTYNQANMIHRAIESSLMQDYINIEIIISDDCSTDNTYEIVKKYFSYDKIKYFRNKTNLGRVKNYKFTLENYATGDWVVNLDGDDFFIDNTFISKSMNLILMYQNVVFLQSGHLKKNFYEIDKIGEVCIPHLKSEYLVINGIDYVINFLKFGHFSHCATIYNRKLAIETDFYINDIPSTDIDSLLRLALKGNVILVKDTPCVWLQHENNVSKKLDINSISRNILWIENVYNECLKYNIEKKKLYRWKKKLKKISVLNNVKLIINSAKSIKILKEVYIYVFKNYKTLLFNFYFNKLVIKRFIKLITER